MQKYRVKIYFGKKIIYNKVHLFNSKAVAETWALCMVEKLKGNGYDITTVK